MRLLSYIATAFISAGIGFVVAAWLAAMKEVT